MTANNNFIGAVAAMLASAILSFSDNFVAAVAQEAGLWQFQVFRTLLAVPLLVLVGIALGASFRPKNMGKLLLRSVVVSAGLLLYFAVLGILPVAQAGAGLFSAPIWVMLLSIAFLGKRVGKRRVLAMIAGFAGVLMLLQPDLATLTVLSALPLLAGAFYGGGALITKHLCGGENALALAIGVFVMMGLASAGLLLFFTFNPTDPGTAQFFTRGWEPLTARFFWLTIGQSVGAAAAVAMIAQAYRIGEPDFVSVCEYSFLIFAAIWAYLLWGQPTNALAQGGIVVIILSGLAMYFLDRKADPQLQGTND